MKRSVVYPDWAEKYRGPGRTIRKVRNGYGLYECTSTYQPGQKYPKSVQTYLGMITEKDGFIPKKTDLTVTPVATRSMEYGLSHFIMANFRRDLMRSVYDASEYMIIYGVIYFIFDDLNEAFIGSTYLCKDKENELLQRFSKGVSLSRLKTISKSITQLIADKIPDEKDRNLMIRLLFLATVNENGNPDTVVYHPLVTDLAEKYGVNL